MTDNDPEGQTAYFLVSKTLPEIMDFVERLIRDGTNLSKVEGVIASIFDRYVKAKKMSDDEAKTVAALVIIAARYAHKKQNEKPGGSFGVQIER